MEKGWIAFNVATDEGIVFFHNWVGMVYSRCRKVAIRVHKVQDYSLREIMQTRINRSLLSNIISQVSRAVSPRSVLPVLSNILVAVYCDRIRFSATDLELCVSVLANVPFEGDGALTVPARSFSDMVNSLSDGPVELVFDVNKAEIALIHNML